ncbi:MAG: type VII secretion integral membrane protein EccD [Jatrophihabitans sp.]
MTLAETKSFARVVVIAPRTRVDLALPIDVPIVDLLPLLLDMVGERSDDGGGAHGGWQLTRVGAGELPSDRTLRALEILDGSVLHLAPRESSVVPPIYDDTVDAIASTIRDVMSLRSTNPATGAAAIVIGLVLGALGVFYHAHNGLNATIAVTVMLLALGIGTAIARGPGVRVIAVAVAAGGLPYAFIAGIEIVPGDIGRSGTLLGFTLMLVYSIFAVVALGTGAVVFATSAIISVFGTGGALISTTLDVKPLYVAAGVCSIGVASVAILPWLVVRLARLPLPVIPTAASDVRSADDVDIGDVTARARLADELLNGSYIACATVVVFSAAVVALHASVMSLLLAAVAVSAMLLRVRTITGVVPRAAILSVTLLGILLGGAVAITGGYFFASTAFIGGALAVTVVAVLISVVAPRVRVSPVTLRLVDFLESLLLVAILPLAVGVMNLYATMRHL